MIVELNRTIPQWGQGIGIGYAGNNNSGVGTNEFNWGTNTTLRIDLTERAAFRSAIADGGPLSLVLWAWGIGGEGAPPPYLQDIVVSAYIVLEWACETCRTIEDESCLCCAKCGSFPCSKTCVCAPSLPPVTGGGGISSGGFLGGTIFTAAQQQQQAAQQQAVSQPAEVSVTSEVSDDGSVSVNVGLTVGNNSVASVASPVQVQVPLEVGGENHHRYVAIDVSGNIVGGSYNPATGIFTFETTVAGNFEIVYVENLKRISITIGSLVINDLAGNAESQTMDVAPVIENGRTLIPVRFMAYALGADVAWNAATREVTLTLDGVPLTFGIGEVSSSLAAMGMDVPAHDYRRQNHGSAQIYQ
jgi:hypothetical protein